MMYRNSQFLYPSDVINKLRDRWKRLQDSLRGKPLPTVKTHQIEPSFPEEKSLRILLDTMYHVSFLTEETRRVALRIAYVTPQAFEPQMPRIMNLDGKPIFFTPPRPLTVPEALRLAPAIDPAQSLLLVASGSDLAPEYKPEPLMIWGILHLGLDWWRAITGRSTGAMCPPNCLTISTFGPGNLTVSSIGTVILRLQQGKEVTPVLESIGDGPIGAFLEPHAQSLYNDVIEKLKVRRYHTSKDSDRHPYQQYYRTLENTAYLSAEKQHGATFVVLPKEIRPDDQRLKDRINLKYILKDAGIWKSLIDESIANRNYYRYVFADKHRLLEHDSKASPEALKELIHWSKLKDSLEEKIHEYEEFVSSLSSVDGVVVLNTHLEVLGFGGEITAQSPSLSKVRVASNADATHSHEQDITLFGTRHRSAFRLCSSYEDLIVFVVSQDGGIKAVKRVGPDVVFWPNVRVGRYSL